MRLLLINPNTTEAITARAAAAAMAVLPPGIALETVTGRFGCRYVASRAAFAIAGHAALDAYARHGAGCDAVLLACFGDPGLDGLKELADVPVVALAEASFHVACLAGRRFGIVTGGERWGTMLEDCVAAHGLGERLSGIETLAPSGAEIAANPDKALDALAAACQDAVTRGADVVILGGAGLAGLAASIAPRVPVPVICSVEAGVLAVTALMRLGLAQPARGSHARTPSVESIGLDPALAALLGGAAFPG